MKLVLGDSFDVSYLNNAISFLSLVDLPLSHEEHEADFKRKRKTGISLPSDVFKVSAVFLYTNEEQFI